MRPIVTDRVAWCVCRSVTIASPGKTAEQIEMSFRLLTQHVLDGGAHWRNLANTIEPSMCGGDAAVLSNYFDGLLLYMVALCNRAGHIYFHTVVCSNSFFLSSFFFPRLISAVADWMSTILAHSVALVRI